MRRMFGLAVLALLSGCTAPPPPDPGPQPPMPPGPYPVEFRCPAPGTVIRTSLGTTLSYDGALPNDPETCRFARSDRQGEWWSLYAIYSGRANFDQMRPLFRRLFPLAPGKTVRGFVTDADNFSRNAWEVTFTAVARARLNVPAGMFDAWAIRVTEQGSAGNPYLAESTWYLDSATWVPVKFDRRVLRGDPFAGEQGWEAVSLTRGR